MNSAIDCFDQEASTSINKSRVYSDNDGIFDCTLIKYADDNKTILDEIQITIINESFNFFLLIHKSNDKSRVDVSDSNIELVKSRFYATFHSLTGNYWKYRDQFIKTPGHYYLSIDLDSSSSSEEQEARLNRINKIPKYISTERAFFNSQTNSIQKTYTYAYDGLNYYIVLPKNPSENLISSLLFVRKMVLRIGILYKYKSSIEMFFASGFLLTDRHVLTCAHNFDPIQWGKEKVSYDKIYVCFLDPASETYFLLNDPNNFLIQAKILRRGLIEDNMSDYDEVKSNTTDLAILELDKVAPHIQLNEYFDPKLHSSSESNIIPINSELFLIGYNGELTEDDELKPYKYLKGFENLTIDALNYSHHVNYKSISIGRLKQESSIDSKYAMHDCSTLSGSSGAVILDSSGKFVGIHIGVVNSRKEKKNEFFFNQETFNKFIQVNSKPFREFIRQAIIPNMHNHELVQKWSSDSK
ncbi:unnamed protein product [Rotaria sordida]|uniref:Serine protease n=1 Tax=Rotaria sordida TaxID=392033 RepID=A0A815DFT4_9BILA|nr:unnamed protein product [Rotaria sordida]